MDKRVKSKSLKTTLKRIIMIVFVASIIPVAKLITINEASKSHPVIRYREDSKRTNIYPEEDNSRGMDKGNSTIESDNEEQRKGTYLKIPYTNFAIEFISCEIIDESYLRDNERYSVNDYMLREFPDVDYQKYYFDAKSAAKESEVMNLLFGENSSELNYEQWLNIYEDNSEEVDMYREKHIIYYHPQTDYYFVKCCVTNTTDSSVKEQYDDEGNMIYRNEYSLNGIKIVMSNGMGSFYYSDEPVYLFNGMHNEDDDRIKSFFKLTLKPGESREVVIGIPVAYDKYQYNNLGDKSLYRPYIGILDMTLIDEGIDPALGPDMIPLDNIEYGN